MKAIQQTDVAQKLMGAVRLARLQLAKAESRLAEAKEQARLARQRRKEAKQTARRAKKQAKQARKKVTGAKLARAELEARLARPNPTRVKRKARSTPPKKVAAASRRKSLVTTMNAKSRGSLKVRKPVVRRAASRRKPRPTGKAAKRRIARLRDLAPPVVLIPPEVGEATGQIVEEAEKTFTGGIQPEMPAKPAFLESRSPLEANPATPDQASTNSIIHP